MPELPEVEIVRQSLNRQVKNRKIINIQVNNRNLRLKVPKDFEQIFKNAVIEKIQRKYKIHKIKKRIKHRCKHLFNIKSSGPWASPLLRSSVAVGQAPRNRASSFANLSFTASEASVNGN